MIQLSLFETYYPTGSIVRETGYYRRVGIVARLAGNGYHHCYPIPYRGGHIFKNGSDLELVAFYRPVTLDDFIRGLDEIYRFVADQGIRLEDFYYKFSTYCGDQDPAYQSWLDKQYNKS